VDHRVVLHVAAVADPDVVAVAAQHRAEPNARVAAEVHSTDDGCARRDEELVADGLHAMRTEVVDHACYFFAFAWFATACAAAAIAAASPRYSARFVLRRASSS